MQPNAQISWPEEPHKARTTLPQRLTVSVHFGAKLARGVRTLSSTEIAVSAPSGSGTVYVTVSAMGGSSGDVAAGRYHY